MRILWGMPLSVLLFSCASRSGKEAAPTSPGREPASFQVQGQAQFGNNNFPNNNFGNNNFANNNFQNNSNGNFSPNFGPPPGNPQFRPNPPPFLNQGHNGNRFPMPGGQRPPEETAGCPDLYKIPVGQATAQIRGQDRYGRPTPVQRRLATYSVGDLVEKGIGGRWEGARELPTITGSLDSDREVLKGWFEKLEEEDPNLLGAMQDIPMFQKVFAYLRIYKNTDVADLKAWEEYWGAARTAMIVVAALTVKDNAACFNEITRKGYASFNNAPQKASGAAKGFAEDIASFARSIKELTGKVDSEDFDDKFDRVQDQFESAHEAYLEAKADFDERMEDNKERLAELDEEIENEYSDIQDVLREDFKYCHQEGYVAGYHGKDPTRPTLQRLAKALDRCNEKLSREIDKLEKFIETEQAANAASPNRHRLSRASRVKEAQRKKNKLVAYENSLSDDKLIKSFGDRVEKLLALIDDKSSRKSKEIYTEFRKSVGRTRQAKKDNAKNYVEYTLASLQGPDLSAPAANNAAENKVDDGNDIPRP